MAVTSPAVKPPKSTARVPVVARAAASRAGWASVQADPFHSQVSPSMVTKPSVEAPPNSTTSPPRAATAGPPRAGGVEGGACATHAVPLKGSLLGQEEDVRQGQLAGELGMEPGALRVTIHRMRERYQRLLEAEIAHTVEGAEGVSAELADLRAALRP
jgi:hypothetical protein